MAGPFKPIVPGTGPVVPPTTTSLIKPPTMPKPPAIGDIGPPGDDFLDPPESPMPPEPVKTEGGGVKITPPLSPPAVAPAPMPRPAPAAPPTSWRPGFVGPSQPPSAWDPRTWAGRVPNLKQVGQQLQHGVVSHLTKQNPPLTHLTHHLGSAKPTVDAILKFIQSQVQDPSQFAMWASSLGAPLTKGILGAPLGLPALIGMHGLLAGGDAYADMHPFMPSMSSSPAKPAVPRPAAAPRKPIVAV